MQPAHSLPKEVPSIIGPKSCSLPRPRSLEVVSGVALSSAVTPWQADLPENGEPGALDHHSPREGDTSEGHLLSFPSGLLLRPVHGV